MGVDINRNYNDHWGGVSYVNAPFTPPLSLSLLSLRLGAQTLPAVKHTMVKVQYLNKKLRPLCNISSSYILYMYKATIHNNYSTGSRIWSLEPLTGTPTANLS